MFGSFVSLKTERKKNIFLYTRTGCLFICSVIVDERANFKLESIAFQCPSSESMPRQFLLCVLFVVQAWSINSPPCVVYLRNPSHYYCCIFFFLFSSITYLLVELFMCILLCCVAMLLLHRTNIFWSSITLHHFVLVLCVKHVLLFFIKFIMESFSYRKMFKVVVFFLLFRKS